MTLQLGKSLTFQNIIVCEDVRPEPGGKWSILGAFSGDIVVAALPGALKLALYADGTALDDMKGSLWIKLSLDGSEILKLPGEYEGKKGPVSFPIPGIAVIVPKEGQLEFAFSEDDKTWVVIAKKQISIGTIKS